MSPTERTRDKVWHEVLWWLVNNDDPTVDEIADEVDCSPTTAREVMKIMQYRGWILPYRDGDNHKCYRAGPMLSDLSKIVD